MSEECLSTTSSSSN